MQRLNRSSRAGRSAARRLVKERLLAYEVERSPAYEEYTIRQNLDLVAQYYDELLSKIPGITLTAETDYASSVYHLYVIQVDDRDGLQEFLNAKGIATGLHYPLPLHLQKAYAHLGYKKGDFPVTENIADRLLSLPMYPELSKQQIEYVVQSIEEFLNRT